MLVLDDSFVLLQAGTVASILGAQGLAGAAINAAKQHRDAKALDAHGDNMTGDQFKGQKRSRVIFYDGVKSARIDGTGRGRKLTIETADGAAHLKYAGKVWPDDDAVPFLTGHLGDRFTRTTG